MTKLIEVEVKIYMNLETEFFKNNKKIKKYFEKDFFIEQLIIPEEIEIDNYKITECEVKFINDL